MQSYRKGDLKIKKRDASKWSDWTITVLGYVRRTRMANGKQEYQLQHRYVMEQIIGRELLPGENVHHKNGNRADNRPENLELWVTLQPAGQRPEDLVAYAHEILARYET